MLKVEGLRVRLAGKNVLEEVSFSASSGEVVAIIGPNGAGKSVLLRTIAGLIKPEEGRILLQGEDLSSFPYKKRVAVISFLPQRVQTNFDFTCEEVVSLGLRNGNSWRWWLNPEERIRLEKILKKVGLWELRFRPFSHLSEGERQRTLIAMLLIRRTRVFLLDEPASNLDLKYQLEIYSLIRKMADEGSTIILADHHLHLCPKFCHRVIFLKKGRVLAEGRPEELLKTQLIRELFDVKGSFLPVVP